MNKNKINSIKDLNRINKWFEQGEDEPEEKPKKEKEKFQIMLLHY